MTLHEQLCDRHEVIVEAMLAMRDRGMAPLDEARQFVLGFVGLVEAAAHGDFGPRDEYLDVVIPGLRASGFELASAVDAMVRSAMALVTVVDPEYHRWIIAFCGDYSRRMVRKWGAA